MELALLLEENSLLKEQNNLLQIEVKKYKPEIDSLKFLVEKLQHQLDNLLRHRYGQKSEHVDLQLSLFGNKEVFESTVAPATETITYTRTKSKPRNGCRNLPDNLPRERIEYDLTEEQKVCDCGGKLHSIGEDVLEQLEYVPAMLKVIQHAKHKYACRTCEKILTATMPEQPIAKGFVGPNLLSHIIVSKYEDHLPLHRQERIFARYGMELSKSTLCDWVLQAADLLAPLRERLEQKILVSPKIHTDDSPILVKVGNEQDKNIKTGRLWVYIGCGGIDPPSVIYHYSPNRNSEWPLQFLKDYQGYLQADAYSGYDRLYTTNKIIEVGCFAHARRKFVEIAKNAKAPIRAHQALGYIKKLYDIETEAKDMSNGERKNIRQTKAKPILDEFKKWLDIQLNELPEQTPMYKAVAYSVNAWIALNRYLENGILEIDNNRAERSIRPIAIGRKNWLFAGSDRGGHAAAIIYSLIESCKQHDIKPYVYLADVLAKLPSYKINRIEDLLPQNWKNTQANLLPQSEK